VITQWNGGPTVLPIADAKRCSQACAEVYAARPRWIRRVLNEQPPFYTLGKASYFDLGFAAAPIEDYLAAADVVRSSTGVAVNAIFEDVRDALCDVLGAPVHYPPELPSPGFHIYIGRAIPQDDCAVRRQDCGSCHFDLQHGYVPWSRWYADVDTTKSVSFTLPINLPAAGGGLKIWKSLTLGEIGPLKDFDFGGRAHTTSSEFLRYTVGHLVLHDGHVLHQGAGVSPISVTDERITLQGHGVWADGAWRLYW
jgi:hypothetical protein